MISLASVIAAVVGSFYTVRYTTSENKKKIEAIEKKLEKHGDDLVAIKTKSELAMTAKDVDTKYVSKELFRQFEKHMNGRFDGIDGNLGKILNKLK